MVKIITHARVYSGAELSTDHYLLSVRLSFPEGKEINRTYRDKEMHCKKNVKFVYWMAKAYKGYMKKEWMIDYIMKKEQMLNKNGII